MNTKYDVIVVGGGFSGVAAAIAASRGGANVLLVEKSNCLSGAASNSLVEPFMTTFTKFDGKTFDLSRGIYSEICDELSKTNSILPHRDCFDVERLKLNLNRMMEREGVKLLYRSTLFDVTKDGDKIKSIKLATVGGVIELFADYFVDATGDAQLSFLAGCPFKLGREEDNLCQPMTLCFRVINVDVPLFYKEYKERISDLYKSEWKKGKFRNPRENILVFKTVTPNVLHFNTTRVIKLNPTDAFDLTKAEIEAREQVYEMFDFLKENCESFKNAFLMMTAAEIGVRESRMIEGEYTLTSEELVACVKFEDSIAAGNYDIDIHNPEGAGTYIYGFKEGEYYTIPYRCLIPKKSNNIIVTGRCISTDHEAQASYRIMPTVTCIGQAAGSAAALALKNRISFKDVNTKELQEILKKDGAFLGI